MGTSIARTAGAGLLAVALIGSGAGVAQAQGGSNGEVRVSGQCGTGTTWKLKAKPDDGRLEVELELDSNRIGERWWVSLADNRVRVFTGRRVTVAPSGSFEVNRRIMNRRGQDRITARARSTRTGEFCSAVVVYSS